MDELNQFFSILYEKGGEGGSGGGGEGDSPSTGQETAIKENNSDIKELSRSISGGDDEEGKDSPLSRHIGYFPDDEAPEEGDSPEGEQPEAADRSDDFEDDFEDESDIDEFQEASESDSEATEGESPEAPEGKEEYFYVPERDAEGRDPYPNDYETRMDAQFAVAEKIETFDKYAEQLQESGSDVGAAIDPSVKDKIEKYRDLDYANQVDDDQLRSDIVDLDEGLKAVKFKVDRVQKKSERQQTRKEAEKKYKQAEKDAAKASEAIGLPDRLGELPKDAEKGDLMELVDDQIQQQLSEIDSKISKFKENAEDYVSEHSAKQYTNELEALQAERRELSGELQEHRSNIESWWDAQEDYLAAKEKSTDMTEAEKAQRVDDAFLEFQEDRSQGPNALDIFTKSKDTKPIVHFRQYALSPANRDKFDLTTTEGWLRAYKDWRSWIDENVKSKKSTNQKKKSEAEKKKKGRKPIPPPSRRGGQSIVPNGTDMDGLRKVNDDIGRLAREIMKG